MGKFKANENILYLSTRTSPLQLAKDHPWIADVAGLSAEHSAQSSPEEGWETLVDARLDEPGVVFERITNVLMDKHAPTVVVDSWEALSESMDEEALRTNIRVLQTWRERAGARLIFIGEDSANTAIDSVVDGVVTLSVRAFSGRRLREIYLSKLHGVKILRPGYYFSLENGVFRSFDRYRQSDFAAGAPTRTHGAQNRSGDKRRISTGFQSLDEALGGGYPAKSAAWIEVDPRVDAKVVNAFLSETIRGWASGGTILLQKLEGTDPAGLTQRRTSLRGAISGRILQWDSRAGGKKGKSDRLADLQSKIDQAKAPILAVLDLDKIFASSESARPTALESLIGTLKSRVELCILLSKSNPAQQPQSGIVSTHLKISEINGTLFATSEKPWSELYAMVSENGPGSGSMRLERVV